LFSLSLFAFSDSDVLRHAVALEKSSTNSGQSRAYDDYKKLHIKALMHNNNWLRLQSLRGIIRTGKRLHIDVSAYKKELSKSLYTIKRYSSKKRTKIKIKSSHKLYTIKRYSSKKRTKIKIKSSHKLQSIRWINGDLELLFDKKLRNNQINYYKKYDSKRKIYQYIFNKMLF